MSMEKVGKRKIAKRFPSELFSFDLVVTVRSFKEQNEKKKNKANEMK